MQLTIELSDELAQKLLQRGDGMLQFIQEAIQLKLLNEEKMPTWKKATPSLTIQGLSLSQEIQKDRMDANE